MEIPLRVVKIQHKFQLLLGDCESFRERVDDDAVDVVADVSFTDETLERDA